MAKNIYRIYETGEFSYSIANARVKAAKSITHLNPEHRWAHISKNGKEFITIAKYRFPLERKGRYGDSVTECFAKELVSYEHGYFYKYYQFNPKTGAIIRHGDFLRQYFR